MSNKLDKMSKDQLGLYSFYLDLAGIIFSALILLVLFTGIVSVGATIPILFGLIPIDICISLATIGLVIYIILKDQINGDGALAIGGVIVVELLESYPAVGVLFSLVPSASLVYIWRYGFDMYKKATPLPQ